MATLDVTGLPDEKVTYLKQLIEKWRHAVSEEVEETEGNDVDREIVFATYDSAVIGPLTRREIYNDVE